MFINVRYADRSIETIDEFDNRKEALQALREYRLIYDDVYTSSRCTNQWREDSKQTNES
jgi:hypothetical protein